MSALLGEALRQVLDDERRYEEVRRLMLRISRRDICSAPVARSTGPGTPCMSAREFVDTNVLVYAFDRSAGRKRAAAIELLERL